MNMTVQERALREKAAQQLVLARSGVIAEDLETTRRALVALGAVSLDDLRVSPGFNLLADGSVGSINDDTPECRTGRRPAGSPKSASTSALSLGCWHE